MFIDHEAGIAFVHVPRTGGVWMTRALMAAALRSGKGEHVSLDLIHRHRPVQFMREWYWGKRALPWTFTIIRAPWEIILSDYALTMRDVTRMDAGEPLQGVNAEWVDRVKRTAEHRDLVTFIEREYVQNRFFQPGGFWATYCTADGLNIAHVTPFRHHDIQRALATACDKAGYQWTSDVLASHRPVNACDYPKPELSLKAYDLICELCWMDLNVYSWSPPASIEAELAGR